MMDDLDSIAGNFGFEGRLVDASPYGSGHIHRTFALRCAGPHGETRRYLLQNINQAFDDVDTALLRSLKE